MNGRLVNRTDFAHFSVGLSAKCRLFPTHQHAGSLEMLLSISTEEGGSCAQAVLLLLFLFRACMLMVLLFTDSAHGLFFYSLRYTVLFDRLFFVL